MYVYMYVVGMACSYIGMASYGHVAIFPPSITSTPITPTPLAHKSSFCQGIEGDAGCEGGGGGVNGGCGINLYRRGNNKMVVHDEYNSQLNPIKNTLIFVIETIAVHTCN